MQIRLEHLKLDKSKHNLKCTKRWFVKHGVDWGDFIKNGLPSDYLLGKDPTHEGLRELIERAKKHEASKAPPA